MSGQKINFYSKIIAILKTINTKLHFKHFYLILSYSHNNNTEQNKKMTKYNDNQACFNLHIKN